MPPIGVELADTFLAVEPAVLTHHAAVLFVIAVAAVQLVL
jgi:hypothetical protein